VAACRPVPGPDVNVCRRPGEANRSGVDIIVLLLLILAVVCFGAAAFGAASRFNLVAAGLLCWVLTVLATRVG